MEKEKEEMSIGVLDIYGFEIFEVWSPDEKERTINFCWILKPFSFSRTEQSVWTICHQLCQRETAANLHWTHTQNGAGRAGSSTLLNTKRSKKINYSNYSTA